MTSPCVVTGERIGQHHFVRYLRIGRSVIPVTDEVAHTWPDLEEQARQEADRLGLLTASISYRTDTGVFGILSVRPEYPSSFTDDGEPPRFNHGTIISASADPDRISREVRAEQGPAPELTDEQVQDLVRRMQEERPDLDWKNLLTGRLAGPATTDRPDLPVWDYLAFIDSHPEVRLSDLTAIRFPAHLFEGPWTVTSIDEELRPLPSSHKGPPLKPAFIIDPPAVVRRYAALHDAGVIEWDPSERGIVYVQPLSAYRAVLHAWARTLRSAE